MRGDLIREELAIQVNPEQTREERLAWLAQTLGVGGGLVQGQGLIYCLTQRDCEHVAEYLQQHGVSARAYHSGLDQEVSDRALADYEAGDVRVLCCTIKLGMGYDKADIRFVINFQLPENLISYYQQIGRAGRDGKRAWAVLLHGRRTRASSRASSIPLSLSRICSRRSSIAARAVPRNAKSWLRSMRQQGRSRRRSSTFRCTVISTRKSARTSAGAW